MVFKLKRIKKWSPAFLISVLVLIFTILGVIISIIIYIWPRDDTPLTCKEDPKACNLGKPAKLKDLPKNLPIKNDRKIFKISTAEKHLVQEGKVHYTTSQIEFQLNKNLDYRYIDIKADTTCYISGESKKIIKKSYQFPISYQFSIMKITPIELAMTKQATPKLSKVFNSLFSKGFPHQNSLNKFIEQWHILNSNKRSCTYKVTFIDNLENPKKESSEPIEKKINLVWVSGAYGVKDEIHKEETNKKSFDSYNEEFGQKVKPYFLDNIHNLSYKIKKYDDINRAVLICSLLENEKEEEIYKIHWKYEERKDIIVNDVFLRQNLKYYYDSNKKYNDEDFNQDTYSRIKSNSKLRTCRVVFYEDYGEQHLIRYFSREFILSSALHLQIPSDLKKADR